MAAKTRKERIKREYCVHCFIKYVYIDCIYIVGSNALSKLCMLVISNIYLK